MSEEENENVSNLYVEEIQIFCKVKVQEFGFPQFYFYSKQGNKFWNQ